MKKSTGRKVSGAAKSGVRATSSKTKRAKVVKGTARAAKTSGVIHHDARVTPKTIKASISVGPTQVHVVPSKGGWDVKKPGAGRASAHEKTKAAAEKAAKKIVRNAGGGEVLIHGRDGRIRDSDTVGKGRVGREIKDAPRGGQLTKSEVRDAVLNGSKALRGVK